MGAIADIVNDSLLFVNNVNEAHKYGCPPNENPLTLSMNPIEWPTMSRYYTG
jgi:hypothetical protein